MYAGALLNAIVRCLFRTKGSSLLSLRTFVTNILGAMEMQLSIFACCTPGLEELVIVLYLFGHIVSVAGYSRSELSSLPLTRRCGGLGSYALANIAFASSY